MIAVLAIIGVILLTGFVTALAIDAGCCRQSLIRYASWKLQRPVSVSGALDVRVLAVHPWARADGVTIGNPAWLPAGETVRIGSLEIRFEPPWRPGPLSFALLSARDAHFTLTRNRDGVANWMFRPPDPSSTSELPVIHSLSIPHAQLSLDDEIRHLQFRGEVTVDEQRPTRPGAAPGLQMSAKGQLNDRPVSVRLTGDPLADANHARPYAFTFFEQSGETTLAGQGRLQRPFKLTELDAQFTASGPNLKDLYHLVGVSLINTGAFQVSGRFERRDAVFRYRDLSLESGDSDLHGEIDIDSSRTTPVITANLHSARLRMTDIGARAAGLPVEGPVYLLSNATFSRKVLLRSESAIDYRADRVQIGRVPLSGVSARVTLHDGVLQVASLRAELYQGRLQSHLTVDAKPEVPVADVDIRWTDVQLAAIPAARSSTPPIEGAMHGRVRLQGYGRSIHEVAASGTGQLAAVVPQGAMRASFAELAGLDLRGLGLLMAKEKKDTDIRCGVASFAARAGTLTSQTLLLETDRVRVTGDGHLDLGTEALEFRFQGHPNHARLMRLQGPVLLRGTLTHPMVSVQSRSVLAQTAAAVALGIVLTPLASVLAFVDAGSGKASNCAAAIDGVTADVR